MYYFPNFAIKKNKELWAPREGETRDVGKHGPTVKPIHWGDTQAFLPFKHLGQRLRQVGPIIQWPNLSIHCFLLSQLDVLLNRQ